MLKRKVTLQVEVTIFTEDELETIGTMENAAAAHTKNCLLDHPDVECFNIEDVDVVVVKSEEDTTANRIKSEYDKYVKAHGKAPLFAECHVNFKDDDKGYDEVIKLVPSTEEEQDGEGDDNEIFFYCNGVDEFVKLTQQDNGEDFVVTDFFCYFGEI